MGKGRSNHPPTKFKLTSVASLRRFSALLSKGSPKHNRNRSITNYSPPPQGSEGINSARSLETLITNRDEGEKQPQHCAARSVSFRCDVVDSTNTTLARQATAPAITTHTTTTDTTHTTPTQQQQQQQPIPRSPLFELPTGAVPELDYEDPPPNTSALDNPFYDPTEKRTSKRISGVWIPYHAQGTGMKKKNKSCPPTTQLQDWFQVVNNEDTAWKHAQHRMETDLQLEVDAKLRTPRRHDDNNDSSSNNKQIARHSSSLEHDGSALYRELSEEVERKKRRAQEARKTRDLLLKQEYARSLSIVSDTAVLDHEEHQLANLDAFLRRRSTKLQEARDSFTNHQDSTPPPNQDSTPPPNHDSTPLPQPNSLKRGASGQIPTFYASPQQSSPVGPTLTLPPEALGSLSLSEPIEESPRACATTTAGDSPPQRPRGQPAPESFGDTPSLL